MIQTKVEITDITNIPIWNFKDRQIVILSGKTDSGKSTTLKKWINYWQKNGLKVGGIITETIIDNNGNKTAYIGHNVISDKKFPLLNIKPDQRKQNNKVGRYFINEAGFNGLLKSLALDNIEVCVIDEIGPLELQEKGFFPFLELVIKSEINALLVVREECVEDISEIIGKLLHQE